MLYTKLGQTDISVSKICLGCMSFGVRGLMHDWTLDETESEKLFGMHSIQVLIFSIRQTGIRQGLAKNF